MMLKPDGSPVAGAPVKLRLSRVQWTSVRRAEGGGFYEWETSRTLVPAGEWTVTSKGGASDLASLHIPVAEGGYYFLNASSVDAAGRPAESSIDFYATGSGYTAWERYDHNRIDLVPEKKTLAPGDTARILVKSPWETATILLTKEREGIRSRKVIPLASTQAMLEVPITEDDVPNVFVSVVLIKGRTEAFSTKDLTDPGKPSFRVGYAELKVEQAVKRLAVDGFAWPAAAIDSITPGSACNAATWRALSAGSTSAKTRAMSNDCGTRCSSAMLTSATGGCTCWICVTGES